MKALATALGFTKDISQSRILAESWFALNESVLTVFGKDKKILHLMLPSLYTVNLLNYASRILGRCSIKELHLLRGKKL